jgi:UDPglucose--hexose-1-phosphate uridylyltransferase
LHTQPLRSESMKHFHWHFEIVPKLTSIAGFEWGSGFYINPMPPEEAALYLRESLEKGTQEARP